MRKESRILLTLFFSCKYSNSAQILHNTKTHSNVDFSRSDPRCAKVAPICPIPALVFIFFIIFSQSGKCNKCVGRYKNSLYLPQILSNLSERGPIWKEIIGPIFRGVSHYVMISFII